MRVHVMIRDILVSIFGGVYLGYLFIMGVIKEAIGVVLSNLVSTQKMI